MTDVLLQVQHASLGYSKTSHIVSDVSLNVRAGSSVGIVGESGSGKTTLARGLVGLLPPQEGSIRIAEQDWASLPRRGPGRRKVQMIFQDPYASLNPTMTALATVSEAFFVAGGRSRKQATAEARALLSEVGLPDVVQRQQTRRLSGGQCQRVGIARVLACEPDVLLADEPTAALDVSVQAQILNLLIDLRQSRNLALIMVSHDLAVIRYMTTETLVMYRGRVVEHGPTAEVFDNPKHHYTRLLIDSLPENDAGPRIVANDASSGCVFAPRCPAMRSDCQTRQPDLHGSATHRAACVHPLGPSGTDRGSTT